MKSKKKLTENKNIFPRSEGLEDFFIIDTPKATPLTEEEADQEYQAIAKAFADEAASDIPFRVSRDYLEGYEEGVYHYLQRINKQNEK